MHQSSEYINLDNLVQLSSSLYGSTDEKYIYNTVLLSLMGKFGIIRGAIFKECDADRKLYKLVVSKGKSPECISGEIHINDILKLCGAADEYYRYNFNFTLDNARNVVICLSSKVRGDFLDNSEKKYAELVIKLLTSAVHNANNFNQLKDTEFRIQKQNQILQTLFDINKDYSIITTLPEIIKIFSYRLMGQLMVSKFALYLYDDGDNYHCEVNKFKNKIPASLVDLLNGADSPFYINAQNYSDEVKEEIERNSLQLYVPMITQGKKKGFLILSKKLNNKKFNDENLEFIQALSSATIVAIENQRLLEEAIEKRNMERELHLALEIQQNLLPKKIPHIKNYSLTGESLPSKQVGGDYFDFVQLSPQRFLIVIADVSGKGMPAALIMSNVQAAFKALAPISHNLEDLLNRLNMMIFENTAPDKFVTIFAGVLDAEENSFEYINAGHNPPLFINSKNEINELKEGGLFAGMIDENIEYQKNKIYLDIGDVICLYTDGITEAPDDTGEEYGTQGLAEYIIKHKNLSSDVLLMKIFKEISDFSSSTSNYDDQTLILLKRVG